MVFDKALAGGDHCSDARFHIGGAASVHESISDFGREWIAGPFFERAGGYHVGVSGKGQYGC